MGAGDGEYEAAGAFGVTVAARGREDVIPDMAEVEVEVVGVADAEGNGARDDGFGERGTRIERRNGTDSHPEGVAGGDAARGVRGGSALGIVGEESLQGVRGGLGLNGHFLLGAGVVAGGEDLGEVDACGLDEFKLVIHEGDNARDIQEIEDGGLHGCSLIEGLGLRQ